ncbi:MAG: GxxExxY protein [Candidatus Kuenenia sp.]|nr:GxxExxY protein [Candidatus Kuenenia hertensis]
MIKEEERLSKKIFGAHRHLGLGLLESAYEECLCKEFEIRSIAFERQKPLAVVYKGMTLDCGYKLYIVVGGKVVLELKSVNSIEPIYEAQLLTYLKLSNLKLGMLINFNVPVLKRRDKKDSGIPGTLYLILEILIFL